MGSSVSTPSPPDNRRIRLFLEVTGDDHPRACTGRRLLHRGLATSVPRAVALRRTPTVLDPYASRPLSAADRSAVERGGLLAVDCSWNRAAARGGLPGGREGPGRRRRLPILVAGNPQHYGRLAELNTVEALCAALYLIGHRDEATALLDGFRGGTEFLVINRSRLDVYAAAPDADGVRTAERALFGRPADADPVAGTATRSRGP